MAVIRDPVFDKWWPLGQSLLLIKAKVKDAAVVIEADGKRLAENSGNNFKFAWVTLSSINDLFASVNKFVHYPSQCFAIPTTGEWTVVWNNSSLCSGHDSMGYCLTTFWGVETIHFNSHDRHSITLAGTHFSHHIKRQDGTVHERSLYCSDQDGRWYFHQKGEPLPEEDLESYNAKRKRDRLNEKVMMELLGRLGIQPWLESTYDFSQPCFLQMNEKLHRELDGVDFKAIRRRALSSQGIVEEEEKELVGPPDYLRGKSRSPHPDGPARLLADGRWCGHGEKEFWLYDIEIDGDDLMSVRLPDGSGPPVVEVTATGKGSFAVYDSRRHPASVFIDSKEAPGFQTPYSCPKCNSTLFRASVGFEVPPDCQSPNDTSWFALALECGSCDCSGIVFNDETA